MQTAVSKKGRTSWYLRQHTRKPEGQAGYADILLLGKTTKRWEIGAMDYYYGDDEALNEAIDELIAQMAWLAPDLIKEEAREVIAETVGHLLRDVGKVDPPFPRL